jgi:uncharacterized phage protein (TIGR02218 family)
MTISVSSVFFERLQLDDIEIVELIDLETPNGSFHWTTRNEPLFATYSGATKEYGIFPGDAQAAQKQNSNLKVATARFTLANSGSVFDAILTGQELMRSRLTVSRVFPDTPDLGRWYLYQGPVGDIAWNRDTISGNARDLNTWVDRRFPPYSYQDKCSWRFGSTGCGVVVSSFTVTISGDQIDVSSSSRMKLIVTSFPGNPANGHFDFGRVSFFSGANSGSVRTIRVHTGQLLALSHNLPSSVTSTDAFSLSPGCRRRLLTDCHSKFDNSGRFLGFKWIPLQEQGAI